MTLADSFGSAYSAILVALFRLLFSVNGKPCHPHRHRVTFERVEVFQGDSFPFGINALCLADHNSFFATPNAVLDVARRPKCLAHELLLPGVPPN